jgi:hypothetical protein
MYWSVLACVIGVEYIAEWLVSWSVLFLPSGSNSLPGILILSNQDPLLLPRQNALPSLHRPPTDPGRVLPLSNTPRASPPRPRVPNRRSSRTAPHPRVCVPPGPRTHALGLHHRERDRPTSRAVRRVHHLGRRLPSARATPERLSLRPDADARYALAHIRSRDRSGRHSAPPASGRPSFRVCTERY